MLYTIHFERGTFFTTNVALALNVANGWCHESTEIRETLGEFIEWYERGSSPDDQGSDGQTKGEGRVDRSRIPSVCLGAKELSIWPGITLRIEETIHGFYQLILVDGNKRSWDSTHRTELDAEHRGYILADALGFSVLRERFEKANGLGVYDETI